MKYDELLEKILERASAIHAGVNQHFDIYPYSFHLERVLDAALKYGKYFENFEKYKYVIVFGACFHDTIEDARLTYHDVLKEAKELLADEPEMLQKAIMAAEIVYALTNEKGRNRAERANEKYYEGIRKTPFASFVKCCDRMANASYAIEHKTSMGKKYRQEMPDFITHVVCGHPESELFSVPERLLTDLASI